MRARSSLAAILLFALAARCASCRPVGLELSFHVPPDLRPQVSELQVRFIAPGGPDSGNAFGCEDIAYSQLSEEQVLLRQEQSWRFTPDASFSLGNVPRTGTKLFWVDGLDPTGRRVVTGCSAVDALTDITRVDIEGFPVVRAAPDPSSLTFADPSPPASLPITLLATDALGRLTAVPYRYLIEDVTGPLGSGSGDGGPLSVSLPARRGPFTVLIAPRWSETGVVRVNGMRAPQRVELQLAVPALNAIRAGRFTSNGGGAVALLLDDGSARHVMLVGTDGGAGLAPRAVWDVDAGVLLGLHQARAPDRLFAGGGGALVELRDGLSSPIGISPLPDPADSIFAIDTDCDGGQVVLLTNQSGRVFPQPLGAGPLGDAGQGRVLAAGCLTPLDGGARASVLVEDPTGTRQYVPWPPGAAVTRWWGVGEAVAFSGAGTGPRRLVGVEALGQVFAILRAQPAADSTGVALVPVGALDPMPYPPVALVTGDFDGNGTLDVAALIAVTPVGAAYAFLVFVVLEGPDAHGVAGAFELGAFTCPPVLDAVDLFGGRGEELVVGFPCRNAAMATPLLGAYRFEN